MSQGKHAKVDSERGTFKLRDLRPKNLLPQAKFRLIMLLVEICFIILGCFYLLSMTTITPLTAIDTSTAFGITALTKDCLAGGYIVTSVLIIFVAIYLAFKDLPLTPAGKANYSATHDKNIKGVKVVSSLIGAVTSRGSATSIDAVATALDNYLDDTPAPNPKVRQNNG